MMVTHGLLARLKAQSHQSAETEQLLKSALRQVQSEPATAAWFALRFGRHDYGIFDAFSSEEGRLAHLEGPVANALVSRAPWLLDRQPDIDAVEVIASKMPAQLRPEHATCGLLLSFRAKKGHELEVEQFLRDAQSLVEEEPGTTAWFALRWPERRYGIFDVFPNHAARTAHVTGHVPRELTRHAFRLLGGLPSMDLADVLASHLAERTTLVGLGVD
jgi:quinol monooxygenase YgiN